MSGTPDGLQQTCQLGRAEINDFIPMTARGWILSRQTLLAYQWWHLDVIVVERVAIASLHDKTISG